MGKIYDAAALRKALSQRCWRPMLDRAEILDDTRAVAVKNLTNNEEFFNGHFPNHPIMPGVLQLEAMRQLSGLTEAYLMTQLEHSFSTLEFYKSLSMPIGETL